MLDTPPAFGRQTYRIEQGAARIVQAVHQLRPEPSEADAGFLNRILADITRGTTYTADLIIYRQDGRIKMAEIILDAIPAPASTPENPPTH